METGDEEGMKKKKALVWLICLFLLLLPGCARTQTDAAQEHEVGLEDMFVAGKAFRVTYEDVTSKDAERTQIGLDEEEREELLSMLKPYVEDLTTDVLKSDFPVYYLVKLNDVLTLQIDAQGEYPKEPGKTYMLVNRHVGNIVTQYGAYIGTEVLEFLEGKRG